MSEAAHEPVARQFTFGPSALVTPANAVTVARLLAAPVYVLMLVAWGASWVNVVVGLILAGSDGLDGYMARRHGTTRSGAFLDPLADKAVVLGALITLSRPGPPALAPGDPHHHPRGRHAGLPLLGRARAASPSRLGSRPSSRRWCRTSRSAPCIIPPLAHQHTLQVAVIWFACALTLYTGAEYLLDGRRALHRPAAP